MPENCIRMSDNCIRITDNCCHVTLWPIPAQSAIVIVIVVVICSGAVIHQYPKCYTCFSDYTIKALSNTSATIATIRVVTNASATIHANEK